MLCKQDALSFYPFPLNPLILRLGSATEGTLCFGIYAVGTLDYCPSCRPYPLPSTLCLFCP